MNANPARRRSIHVTLAASLVVVLAGLLIARIAPGTAQATEGPLEPPAAAVPAPAPAPAAGPEIPCWGCPEAKQWPIRFRTDLDMLAPLGTGTGNAAVWFALFEKQRGPRYPEAVAAMARRVEDPQLGRIMRFDEPLLAEAEPWCDQATMTFYPDIFPLEGYATRITNLLLPLAMAKTWVARGMAAGDGEAAMADFRRAIRLGRLLRQEDTVIISDLVGLACIRYGIEAIDGRARTSGDLRLALVAAAALSEHAPQRLLTAARLTPVDIAGGVSRTETGKVAVAINDTKLGTIIEAARSAPDRRFRGEAIVSLHLIRFLAPLAQQERALGVLNELSGDPDPVIARVAAWSRDTQPTNEMLELAFPDLKM